MSGTTADRMVLKITGSQRETFLQGLVTNDVNRVSSGLVYAALLTPQGKYLADFFLAPDRETILLDCKASQSEALLQRLSLYKLRADLSTRSGDDIDDAGREAHLASQLCQA